MTLDDHMNNDRVERADRVEVVSYKEHKVHKEVLSWGCALDQIYTFYMFYTAKKDG